MSHYLKKHFLIKFYISKAKLDGKNPGREHYPIYENQIPKRLLLKPSRVDSYFRSLQKIGYFTYRTHVPPKKSGDDWEENKSIDLRIAGLQAYEDRALIKLFWQRIGDKFKRAGTVFLPYIAAIAAIYSLYLELTTTNRQDKEIESLKKQLEQLHTQKPRKEKSAKAYPLQNSKEDTTSFSW